MSNNSKIAVPSFATKRVYNRDDKSLGVQMYDIDNLYPQRVRNAINSSGTGTSCTNLFAKHLRGRGYKDETIEKLIVNEKGQTLGEVHKLICADRAMYLGFAFHVSYNALLQPMSIKHIPFEFIRLSLPDDLGNCTSVKLHSDWGRESGKPFDKKLLIEVDLYTNNEEEIFNQINKAGGFENWKGQVYYYSEKGNCIYPPAVCDPVFEDVLTDAGIKMWKFRGISTDFMANYFWVFNGEFADEQEKNDYVEAVNSFQGVDNSHKVVVVECPTPNSKPELIKVDKQDNDKVYELTETTVVENIIRSYGQPKALHSISVAGSLGLTKEIEEGKTVYDERTADEREKLGLVFREVLINWFEGNPSINEDYTIIPITGLTDEKKTKPLAESIEVGKLTALQATLTDPLLAAQQKINFLVIIYGIDYSVASALVNGTTLPNQVLQ
jgi:hypothetical protein